MRRIAVRLSMLLVGLAVLSVHVVAALVGVLFLRLAWATRPPLPTLVVALVATSLLSGYLSYRFGTARLLSKLGARPLGDQEAPDLQALVERLAARMDIDRPEVYLADLSVPNAMALGSARNGRLVLDSSLMRLLSAPEVAAIIAHELAHLERRDSVVLNLLGAVARTVVGILTLGLVPPLLALSGLAKGTAWMLGRPGAARETVFGEARSALVSIVVVAMLGATVLVRARSRRGEFAADERAARLTDPRALASALRKIDRATDPRWGLFSPLVSRQETWLDRLLSTHPDTDERVERLLKRAGKRPTRIAVE